MYCFVDWEHTEEGKAPCLPEGKGFLLIAEPGRDAKWGLFSFDPTDEETPLDGVERVPEDLEALLLSAERYPPAMAFARDQIEKQPRAETLTRRKFCRVYGQLLRSHLNAQASAGYILAEVLEGQTGYKCEGEFVWTVGFIPEQGFVRWVSYDYFIYTDPATDFRLRPEELQMLPRYSPIEDPGSLGCIQHAKIGAGDAFHLKRRPRS